jgi:hypothetical protein
VKLIFEIAAGVVLAWLAIAFGLPFLIATAVNAIALARRRPALAVAASIAGLALGALAYSVLSALHTCYGHYTFDSWC